MESGLVAHDAPCSPMRPCRSVKSCRLPRVLSGDDSAASAEPGRGESRELRAVRIRDLDGVCVVDPIVKTRQRGLSDTEAAAARVRPEIRRTA